MVNGTVQIEDQQYTIQPVLADRLTYVLQRNYEKARDPFVSYFGYDSVTNCTDPTTINWSEKCSKMGFLCSDEIDSFHKMTLRIVLNLMITNIDIGKHIKWSASSNGKLARIPHGTVKRRRLSSRCTPLY